MNKKNIKKSLSSQKGSSIIEMMVAFALLLLAVTAVITVSFGNQSTVVSSELNNKAVYLAEGLMEEAYAQSIEDFSALDSAIFSLLGDPFTKELTVWPSICYKTVESKISWNISSPAPQEISLTNKFVDIEMSRALLGDCPTGDTLPWEDPGSFTTIALGGQGGTGIDVEGDLVYLVSDSSNNNDDDFFIYEFDSDAETLTELKSLDTGHGLTAIDVAGDYAFVTHISKTPPGLPVGKLQVINVAIPGSAALLWSVDIPDVNLDGTSPEGVSVRYYDGYIYVGTHESPLEPEFYVFDVSGDLTVAPPLLIASEEIGEDVRAITVVGDYAYLATADDSHELALVDISGSPNLESGMGFNAPGTHDGSAVTVLEDYIYLGRERKNPTAASDNFFYILDREDILDDASLTDGVVSAEFGTDSEILTLANNSYITGVLIRASGNPQKTLAFVGFDDSPGFDIFNITNPGTIVENSACSALNYSENSTALDMGDDYIFVSNNSQNEIRAIKDLGACTP